MIINDINYLETTNEEVIGGHGYSKDFSFDIDGSLNLDIDVDLDFTKNVDIDVNADASGVIGNTAFFVGEATALGNNGTSELNVVLFTAGGVAEVTATGYSASY